MAASGGHLALWDKDNAEQDGDILDSEYKDILAGLTGTYFKELSVDTLWPHLLVFGVLHDVQVEIIKHEGPRPKQAQELLKVIKMGQLWHYHALMRSLALTGQEHLIPADPAIYLENCEGSKHVMSRRLINAVTDHARYLQRNLQLTPVFNFKGDPSPEVMDISRCFIDVEALVNNFRAHEKDNTTLMNRPEFRNLNLVPIRTDTILGEFNGLPKPNGIQLAGDPGVGKSSYGKDVVCSWCDKFLESEPQSLPSHCSTMVFFEARDIKTTVQEAVRNSLGCLQKDEAILMEHINNGEGIVYVIDAIDELRNPAAIEELTAFVRNCQKPGRPTVLITCRTDLCSIENKAFDRFLVLNGFSKQQAVHYIEKYTQNCVLPTGFDAPPLLDFVRRNETKLKVIMCNPLRLHLFCALALRGQIELKDGEEFNFLKIMEPLENYLLRYESTEVTNEQRLYFYKFYLHLLLNDIHEFSEVQMKEFQVIQAFCVFLKRYNIRDSQAQCIPHFVFTHRVVLEYFSGKGIFSLGDQQLEYLLLILCSEPHYRSVQKLLFEIFQAKDTNHKLKFSQSMIQHIMILQHHGYGFVKKSLMNNLKSKLTQSKLAKLTKLKYELDVHPGIVIASNQVEESQAVRMKQVMKKIDDALCRQADVLRSNAWFDRLYWGGTIRHIYDCLQAYPPELKKTIVQNSIHRLLPSSGDIYEAPCIWYAVGGWRFSYILVQYKDQHTVRAWCAADAAETLSQHKSASNNGKTQELTLDFCPDDYFVEVLGEPEDEYWSTEQWNNMFQVVPAAWIRRELNIKCPKMVSLHNLLSSVLQSVQYLTSCNDLHINSGVAELEPLLSDLATCRKAGLPLELTSVNLNFPDAINVHQHVGESYLNFQNDVVQILLAGGSPLTSILSWMLDRVQLIRLVSEKVALHGGTAELEPLLILVSKCKGAGMKLKLESVTVTLPDSVYRAPEQQIVQFGMDSSDRGTMGIILPETTPLNKVLLWMLNRAAAFRKLSEQITVAGGTEKLMPLLETMSIIRQIQFRLTLWDTRVVLPDVLLQNPHRLKQLRESMDPTWPVQWFTSRGDEYSWQD